MRGRGRRRASRASPRARAGPGGRRAAPFDEPEGGRDAEPARAASQMFTPALQISANETDGDGHDRHDRDVDLAGDDDEREAEGEQTDEDVRRREVEQVGAPSGRSCESVQLQIPARQDQHDEQRLPAPERPARRSAAAALTPPPPPASRHDQLGPPAPAQRLLEPLLDQGVERDGDDDRRALEEDLPELGELEQREAVVDRRRRAVRRASAPRTVPEPPKTFTPPITTAVTTSSSKPVPASRRRRSRSARRT